MESVTEGDLPGAAGGQPSEPISHDPQQPQTCPTGKLRKTAFRFFAGRKSICMLPSFFVGRAKGQARGSSKPGVTKSQTYDGVSRACWDESVRGSGDVTSADFEFHSPNSLVDPRKLQESFERSQSLPRQKRGLRGFFSSIRRHRKNKNVELEKNETFEMSSGETVRVASPNLDRLGDYSRNQSEAPQPNVPIEASSGDLPTLTGSAPENSTKHDMLVPEEDGSQGSTEEEESEQMKTEDDTEEERRRKSVLVTYQQPLSAESEMLRLVDLRADLPEADLPVLSTSSDNLVFGDVSSLKSFDSLTGCGDIIADQDDVSIAESSVSGERASRSAGKRSSCLVTYQGGGEEMATPDEVDNEYLDSLWESEGSDVCYLPSEQTLSPSTTPDQPTSSFQVTTSSGNTGTSPLGMTEAALTPTDLLTPQSDRQGSVPNSDEGYYDSTTPGADEEARDCPPKERLPRDSYSGDALYELFEADDELLSPQVPSKDSQGFLGHNQNKADILYALSSASLETGAMETEEERLSRIQHALLCCELQNLRNASKDQLPYHGDRFYSDKSSADEPHQQQSGRPLQGSHASQERGGGQLQHRTLYGSDSANSADSRSSPQVSETPSPLQDAVMYSEQERCKGSDPSLPPTRGGSQSQEDLMVCFSQALVDFTQNSRRYRNSTESLDCSESSSPFGPSLSALPAIVTFDVVDMENEGECEQPEPAEEEEDLTSPYEDFEDDGCYLQQDAFAECDQRTFDAYEQSLLFSNAWGIASLPRHLSLSRPCPPVPAPLSLNRRSRSLDTDSLEHQTSELYASVLAHGNKVISFQHRKNNPENGDFCDLALPRQPDRDSRDDWRPGHGCEFDSSKKDTSLSHQQQQRSLQGSPWLEVSTCPSGSQPSVRPSYLPLQATYHNSSTARVTKTSAEGNVSAGRSDLYPCSYPPGVKNRPVGITQGIPHIRSDQSSAAREITAKNRRTDIDTAVTKRNVKKLD